MAGERGIPGLAFDDPTGPADIAFTPTPPSEISTVEHKVVEEAARQLVVVDHGDLARVTEHLTGTTLPSGVTLDVRRLARIKAVTFGPAHSLLALGLPPVSDQVAGRRELTAWLRAATGRATDQDLLFFERQNRLVELLTTGTAPAEAQAEAHRHVPWLSQNPDADPELISDFVGSNGLIHSGSAHDSVETEHNRLAAAMVDATTNGARQLLLHDNWHHSNKALRATVEDAVSAADSAAVLAGHLANRATLREAITLLGEPSVSPILDTMEKHFTLNTLSRIADELAAISGSPRIAFQVKADAMSAIRTELPNAAVSSGRPQAHIVAELVAGGNEVTRFETDHDDTHRLRNKLLHTLNEQIVDARNRLDAMTGLAPGVGRLIAVSTELGISGDAEQMQHTFGGTTSGLAVRVGTVATYANFDVTSNGELVDTKNGYGSMVRAVAGRLVFTEEIAESLAAEAQRQIDALDADMTVRSSRPRPPIVWVSSNDVAAEAFTNLMHDNGFDIEVRTTAEHLAAARQSRTTTTNENYHRARRHAIQATATDLNLNADALREALHSAAITGREAASQPLVSTEPQARQPSRTSEALARAAAHHRLAQQYVTDVREQWAAGGLDTADLDAARTKPQRLAVLHDAAHADSRAIDAVTRELFAARGTFSNHRLARIASALDPAATRAASTRADYQSIIRAHLAGTRSHPAEAFADVVRAMDAAMATEAVELIKRLIITDIARAVHAAAITADELGPGSLTGLDSGTAAAIDGSKFNGDERRFAHPRSIRRAIRAAFAAGHSAERTRLEFASGTDAIRHIADTRYLVTTDLGQHFVIDVRPTDLRSDTAQPPVARFESDGLTEIDGNDVPRFSIDVAERARVRDVARALAHEIAEISAIVDGRTTTVDMLRAGVVTPGPLSVDVLSPHDLGRLAEVRHLAYESNQSSWLARRRADRELGSLLKHLGLDLSVDGPMAHVCINELTREQIAEHLEILARDVASDASPFARRLMAVPPELMPHVILANIGRDAVEVPLGAPSYRTMLARNLITQLGGGVVSASAIVVAGGGSLPSLARAAATVGARVVTSFTGAANEKAHSDRTLQIESISKSLSMGAGNSFDRRARELISSADSALHIIQGPPALTEATAPTEPDPLLKKKRSLASFGSTFQRYGGNGAIEAALLNSADRLAGVLTPSAAAILDRSVLGSGAGLIGAVTSTIAEWHLVHKNQEAKSVRTAALTQIEADQAHLISELLLLSAVEVQAGLTIRAEAVRAAEQQDGPPTSPDALVRAIPDVPNVIEALTGVIDRALAGATPDAQVHERLAQLVADAERSRDYKFAKLHRTRRTPQQIEFEEFLATHHLGPDLDGVRAPDDGAHQWYLRLTALDDPALANRVMALLDIPSGIADLRTLIFKGTLGTGVGTGAGVGAFGVANSDGPLEIAAEAAITTAISGPTAGIAEFMTLRGAERKADLINPPRADIADTDLAKFGATLEALQDVVNTIALQQDPTAQVPSSSTTERLAVLQDRFGRAESDRIRPNRATSRFAYGSRFSLSGLFGAALQGVGLTSPVAAAGAAGSAAVTSVGESVIKSETEIAKARRDLFTRVHDEDLRRARDAHTRSGRPPRDDPAEIRDAVDVVMRELNVARIDVRMRDVLDTVSDLDADVRAASIRADLAIAAQTASAARTAAEHAARAAVDARSGGAGALQDYAAARVAATRARDYAAIAENAIEGALQRVEEARSEAIERVRTRQAAAAGGAAATAIGWETIRRISNPTGWRRDADVAAFTPLDGASSQTMAPTAPPTSPAPPPHRPPPGPVTSPAPQVEQRSAPEAARAPSLVTPAQPPLPAPPSPPEHCSSPHDGAEPLAAEPDFWDAVDRINDRTDWADPSDRTGSHR